MKIDTQKIGRLKALTEIVTVLLIDIISVLLIFHISVFVRTDILPFIYAGFPDELPFRNVLNIWWIFLIWIFFFYYEGLYTERFSFWDEIKSLSKVSFFSSIGIFTIVSLGKLSGEISRTVIILMGVLSLFLLPVIRINVKKFLRHVGFFKRRVIILGAGETGRLIAAALKREPNFGYAIVGFVDDDPAKLGKKIDGIKVHRGIDKTISYINRCGVDDIFIAMPGAGKERIQGLVNTLQHKADHILVVPDIFGIAVLGTNLRHFFQEEVLAFEIENNLSKPVNTVIKKSFDLLVSIVLIPALAVPMALLSFLVKIDSKGPVIFSQRRIGKKGKLFRCYKFRTMYGDAEEKLSELLEKDPASFREWQKHWKLKDDPRVTRIGRFLRMTSLDELPQIVNVLKGEMSLVGPRPYLPVEREDMGRHGETILLSRPGLTGLWQVSGRSETSYHHRMSLDLWYVRNWNLWLDMVILLKTIRIVLKREGAY
ncbi:MAG: undecaprenyl-phosphate galactose phosphotransferase WbaP [Nitrospiraceae bacterium]|nr:MAG: undecaprenyl-phosphate galactose phosphotransferase WbaP [Nitrospiraceae bacterium]